MRNVSLQRLLVLSNLCLLTEAWFLFLTTSRWFAVRLDGICSVFVTITAFGCLYFRDGMYCIDFGRKMWQVVDIRDSDSVVFFPKIPGLEPGAVGLALSYAMTLTGMFQWGVRQSAEIENMVRRCTTLNCISCCVLKSES